MGKGQNAGYQCFLRHLLKTLWERRKYWLPAFSLIPTKFSTHPKTNFNFSVTFVLSSANAFIWTSLKFCCLIKSLTSLQDNKSLVWIICPQHYIIRQTEHNHSGTHYYDHFCPYSFINISSCLHLYPIYGQEEY